PPESGNVYGEQQKAAGLQILHAYPASGPDVRGDDETRQQRDRNIGIRQLNGLEVIEKNGHPCDPAQDVKRNDQQVVREQGKAAAEIARTEIVCPVNKTVDQIHASSPGSLPSFLQEHEGNAVSVSNDGSHWHDTNVVGTES